MSQTASTPAISDPRVKESLQVYKRDNLKLLALGLTILFVTFTWQLSSGSHAGKTPQASIQQIMTVYGIAFLGLLLIRLNRQIRILRMLKTFVVMPYSVSAKSASLPWYYKSADMNFVKLSGKNLYWVNSVLRAPTFRNTTVTVGALSGDLVLIDDSGKLRYGHNMNRHIPIWRPNLRIAQSAARRKGLLKDHE